MNNQEHSLNTNKVIKQINYYYLIQSCTPQFYQIKRIKHEQIARTNLIKMTFNSTSPLIL